MENRIKFLLLEKKMSQRELASKVSELTGINMSDSHLSSIINDRIPNPQFKTMKAIAKVLGKPVDKVFIA